MRDGWSGRRTDCHVFRGDSPGTRTFGLARAWAKLRFRTARSCRQGGRQGRRVYNCAPAAHFGEALISEPSILNGQGSGQRHYGAIAGAAVESPDSNAKNPWIPESSKRGNSGDQGFSRGRRIQRVIPDTLKCDRAMPESEWIPSRDQASVFFRLTSVRTRSASKAVSNGLRKVSLNSVRSNPLALSSSLIRPTSTVSL